MIWPFLTVLACQPQIRHGLVQPPHSPVPPSYVAMQEVTAPAVYAPAVRVVASQRTASLKPQFGWPLQGVISSLYGPRGTRHHAGLDVAATRGERVMAAARGVVTIAGARGTYGNLVELEHTGGWTSRYAHLDSIAVQAGQHVARGAELGAVGSTGRATGPHLHFELRHSERTIDPLEVLQW